MLDAARKIQSRRRMQATLNEENPPWRAWHQVAQYISVHGLALLNSRGQLRWLGDQLAGCSDEDVAGRICTVHLLSSVAVPTTRAAPRPASVIHLCVTSQDSGVGSVGFFLEAFSHGVDSKGGGCRIVERLQYVLRLGKSNLE